MPVVLGVVLAFLGILIAGRPGIIGSRRQEVPAG
jgi:hypothetical protein